MSRLARFGIGNSTDILALGPGTEVVDVGGLLAVRTPACPEFRSGNLLVLERQPTAGEVAAVLDRYHALVASDPAIVHEMFAWTASADDPELFSCLDAQGFVIEQDVVFACNPAELSDPGPAQGEVSICRAGDAGDTRALYRLFISAEPISTRSKEELRFLRYRFQSWLEMVQAGQGAGWIAFDEGRAVGGLGVVRLGEIARFQNVFVAPRSRGRGIASSLVHAAGSAFAGEARTLVIVAESGTTAERIYRRLGFRAIERQAIAWRLATPDGA